MILTAEICLFLVSWWKLMLTLLRCRGDLRRFLTFFAVESFRSFSRVRTFWCSSLSNYLLGFYKGIVELDHTIFIILDFCIFSFSLPMQMPRL